MPKSKYTIKPEDLNGVIDAYPGSLLVQGAYHDLRAGGWTKAPYDSLEFADEEVLWKDFERNLRINGKTIHELGITDPAMFAAYLKKTFGNAQPSKGYSQKLLSLLKESLQCFFSDHIEGVDGLRCDYEADIRLDAQGQIELNVKMSDLALIAIAKESEIDIPGSLEATFKQEAGVYRLVEIQTDERFLQEALLHDVDAHGHKALEFTIAELLFSGEEALLKKEWAVFEEKSQQLSQCLKAFRPIAETQEKTTLFDALNGRHQALKDAVELLKKDSSEDAYFGAFDCLNQGAAALDGDSVSEVEAGKARRGVVYHHLNFKRGAESNPTILVVKLKSFQESLRKIPLSYRAERGLGLDQLKNMRQYEELKVCWDQAKAKAQLTDAPFYEFLAQRFDACDALYKDARRCVLAPYKGDLDLFRQYSSESDVASSGALLESLVLFKKVEDALLSGGPISPELNSGLLFADFDGVPGAIAGELSKRQAALISASRARDTIDEAARTQEGLFDHDDMGFEFDVYFSQMKSVRDQLGEFSVQTNRYRAIFEEVKNKLSGSENEFRLASLKQVETAIQSIKTTGVWDPSVDEKIEAIRSSLASCAEQSGLAKDALTMLDGKMAELDALQALVVQLKAPFEEEQDVLLGEIACAVVIDFGYLKGVLANEFKQPDSLAECTEQSSRLVALAHSIRESDGEVYPVKKEACFTMLSERLKTFKAASAVMEEFHDNAPVSKALVDILFESSSSVQFIEAVSNTLSETGVFPTEAMRQCPTIFKSLKKHRDHVPDFKALEARYSQFLTQRSVLRFLQEPLRSEQAINSPLLGRLSQAIATADQEKFQTILREDFDNSDHALAALNALKTTLSQKSGVLEVVLHGSQSAFISLIDQRIRHAEPTLSPPALIRTACGKLDVEGSLVQALVSVAEGELLWDVAERFESQQKDFHRNIEFILSRQCDAKLKSAAVQLARSFVHHDINRAAEIMSTQGVLPALETRRASKLFKILDSYKKQVPNFEVLEQAKVSLFHQRSVLRLLREDQRLSGEIDPKTKKSTFLGGVSKLIVSHDVLGFEELLAQQFALPTSVEASGRGDQQLKTLKAVLSGDSDAVSVVLGAKQSGFLAVLDKRSAVFEKTQRMVSTCKARGIEAPVSDVLVQLTAGLKPEAILKAYLEGGDVEQYQACRALQAQVNKAETLLHGVDHDVKEMLSDFSIELSDRKDRISALNKKRLQKPDCVVTGFQKLSQSVKAGVDGLLVYADDDASRTFYSGQLEEKVDVLKAMVDQLAEDTSVKGLLNLDDGLVLLNHFAASFEESADKHQFPKNRLLRQKARELRAHGKSRYGQAFGRSASGDGVLARIGKFFKRISNRIGLVRKQRAHYRKNLDSRCEGLLKSHLASARTVVREARIAHQLDVIEVAAISPGQAVPAVAPVAAVQGKVNFPDEVVVIGEVVSEEVEVQSDAESVEEVMPVAETVPVSLEEAAAVVKAVLLYGSPEQQLETQNLLDEATGLLPQATLDEATDLLPQATLDEVADLSQPKLPDSYTLGVKGMMFSDAGRVEQVLADDEAAVDTAKDVAGIGTIPHPLYQTH